LDWFQDTLDILKNNKSYLNQKLFNSKDRMGLVKDLGSVFSLYRKKIYGDGFSGRNRLNKNELINFIDLSVRYIDHTISSNIGENKLFHSYNILNFSENYNKVEIRNLYEMLEGQVAVLSSGYLNSKDSIKLLESLYESKIYRQDQKSFMLYPIKKINSFMEKNIIPENLIFKNQFINKMLKIDNQKIISKDVNGCYRFNPNFKNISDLKIALNNYKSKNILDDLSQKDKLIILDIYEKVFNHKAYTGRSSNMFAYEGIGSIYWHMVSKLLLAVQEIYFKSVKYNEDKNIIKTLGEYYYKVRGGLSADKTAKEYGAFPFDAYSHTPYQSGAKQPGMTGQVKEEIITRMGELGCFIEDGCLVFNPFLLRKSEFLDHKREFIYFNILNQKLKKYIKENQLCYTYCQIPITYSISDNNFSIQIISTDEDVINLKSNKISKNISNSIFSRDDTIKEIFVNIPNKLIIF